MVLILRGIGRCHLRLYGQTVVPLKEYCTKYWAALAKKSRCEYAVLITKHHEGFCLFDSKHGHRHSQKLIGRTLVKEYTESFKNEGLKTGIYYSLLDWHHLQYDNAAAKGLRYPKDEVEHRKGQRLDHSHYIEYLHNQVDEILNDTWGYNKFDHNYESIKSLIQTLCKSCLEDGTSCSTSEREEMGC